MLTKTAFQVLSLPNSNAGQAAPLGQSNQQPFWNE
jgi:hypothetical protein